MTLSIPKLTILNKNKDKFIDEIFKIDLFFINSGQDNTYIFSGGLKEITKVINLVNQFNK